MNHTVPTLEAPPGARSGPPAPISAPPEATLPLRLPTKGQSRILLAIRYVLPALLIIAALPFPYGLLPFPPVISNDMGLRIVLAVCILYSFSVCKTATSRIIVVFTYLALMGGIRRWLIPSLGQPNIDALLVVVPAFTLLRFSANFVSRRIPLDTKLSKWILWLLVIMSLEVLNPLQGGLEVGVAGIMFYIVPVLWYYEARRAAIEGGADAFIRAVMIISTIGVMYATYQFFYGFTLGETMWAQQQMNSASQIGGVTRPMSFFNHSGEYARFSALLAVMCIAYWVYHRRPAALTPVPILLAAVFFTGVRGSLLNVFSVGTAMFAVQGRTIRSWIPRGIVAVLIAIAALVWSLKQAEQQEYSAGTQKVVNHTVGGLLNPLDRSKSTAGVHTEMALAGLKKGFTSPLGMGLGATTLAAMKFGGNLQSTEVDISNLYVSLGLVGGTLYVFIVARFLLTAFRLWYWKRTWTSLCLLAVLLFSHFQYLNSGLYAQCMFAWTCIGLMDGLARKEGLA
jgi:hypothetical protein